MRESNTVRLASKACLVLAAAVAIVISPLPLDAACNSPPIAVDDSAATFNESLLIDVLANDSDVDGQALAVTLNGGSCLNVGTATVDFELVHFAPDNTLDADCTLDYTVTDEGGLSAQATVNVSAETPEGLIYFDGFETGDTSAWSPCDSGCV